MNKHDGILVIGSNGLVGKTLTEILKQKGYNFVFEATRENYDLTKIEDVERLFVFKEQFSYVFLCAAKVGGIMANKTYPVEFFEQNMLIGMNVLNLAHKAGVKKLINLGSSCIYPKENPQPIQENRLLAGELERSNEAYALAKIGILKLCQYYNTEYGTNFISVMPTNLYGSYDNFHLQNGHMLPAMMRKLITAKQNQEKEVVVWGTGTPIREFMHVEDLCDALIFLMDNYNDKSEIINIGTGQGESILNVTKTIMKVIDYDVPIVYDTTKPDGTMLKVVDTTKINSLGWKPKIQLEDGIIKVYKYLQSIDFKWKER
jgi:GDP-L-fucose synthase